MWYLFAASSAFLYAFRGVLEKKVIGGVNKYVLGFAIRVFAMPFLLLPLVFRPDLLVPVSELGTDFWVPLLIVTLICCPLETVFYYEALKEEELSLALPILSLAPVATIVAAATFLHEYPTLFGVMGILLILSGVYALKISHAREGILEPIKHLHKSRGVRLMLVVMLSIGVGAIFDKMAVQASNAVFYAAANYVLISVFLFVMAWVRARRHLGQLRTYWTPFTLLGLVVAGYTLFYMLALELGNTAYVIAIKNASVLFTIIFGLALLREKGKRAKLLAGALIFLGLIGIKVLG